MSKISLEAHYEVMREVVEEEEAYKKLQANTTISSRIKKSFEVLMSRAEGAGNEGLKRFEKQSNHIFITEVLAPPGIFNNNDVGPIYEDMLRKGLGDKYIRLLQQPIGNIENADEETPLSSQETEKSEVL